MRRHDRVFVVRLMGLSLFASVCAVLSALEGISAGAPGMFLAMAGFALGAGIMLHRRASLEAQLDREQDQLAQERERRGLVDKESFGGWRIQ